MLLELLHFFGELEVAVHVPAGGGEGLVRELDAGAEDLREAVDLRLARRRQLHAGVLDLFDRRKELVDVGDEALGARLAAEGFSGN